MHKVVHELARTIALGIDLRNRAQLGAGAKHQIAARGAPARAAAAAVPALEQHMAEQHYQVLSDSSTWLMSFAMLLGRLEIFTVLVFFIPSFWQE